MLKKESAKKRAQKVLKKVYLLKKGLKKAMYSKKVAQKVKLSQKSNSKM